VPTAFGDLPVGWRPLPATARSMRPVFKHIDESTIAFRKDSRKEIEHHGEETGCSCPFKAVLVPGTGRPCARRWAPIC